MKKFLFTLIAAVATWQTAAAALPPLPQTVREIQSILDDEKLERYLGDSEPITSIRRASGGYVITTTRKRMLVDVIYTPSKIGPLNFKLRFHKPSSGGSGGAGSGIGSQAPGSSRAPGSSTAPGSSGGLGSTYDEDYDTD